MKKIDGKIIAKCGECNFMWHDPDSGSGYCNNEGIDVEDNGDIITDPDGILPLCPLPNYFDDREEMKNIILNLYAHMVWLGGDRDMHLDWLLKEGLIEPEQCEVT